MFPIEEPLFVFSKIPESLEPLEWAEKYEDALEESLASSGFGVLTGGGAMLSAPDADGHREIEYCGIDVITSALGASLVYATHYSS